MRESLPTQGKPSGNPNDNTVKKTEMNTFQNRARWVCAYADLRKFDSGRETRVQYQNSRTFARFSGAKLLLRRCLHRSLGNYRQFLSLVSKVVSH